MRRIDRRRQSITPEPRPARKPKPSPVVPRPVIPDGSLRLVGCPHPLLQDRIDMVVPAGESLLSIAKAAAFQHHAPEALMRHGYAWLDGKPVPFERWGETFPLPGQTMVFRMVPFGGGGGGGGKNPMRTVLTLAVMVAAVATQQWYLATYGMATISATGAVTGYTIGSYAMASLAAGAVMVGGNMIVNTLVPMATSPASSASGRRQDKETDVYSVSGVSNQLDPWGPVPMALGFIRWAPKHGAKPYTEVSGSDQYVVALLDWGLGPLKIYDIQIGDTALSAYSDYSIQTAEGLPGDPSQNLYTNDIYEDSLSILLEYSSAQVRTTGADADRASVDVSFSSLCDYSSGEREDITVNISVEYSPTGAGTWTAATGFSVTAATLKAVRRAVSITFPSRGQYDIRLTRTTEESAEDGVYEDAYWTALRTITNASPIDVPYTNATSHLRVKATGTLNGTLDKINGLTKTYCLDWDTGTSTWIERETQNPASLYRWVLQNEFNPFPRTDAQIDLDSLADWHEFCAAQGFTFNKVCYGDSVNDLLNEIAAAGRATRVMRDGQWGVVIEQERDAVVFDFTPALVTGGVTITRNFREAPHALRCAFVNEDTWEDDEMIVYGSGYAASNASIFETWAPPGVTNDEQLYALGRYHLNVLYQRRETITWNADFAHLVCQRADLVSIAHPVVGTGLAQGRVTSVTDNGGGSYTIGVNEPCTMVSNASYSTMIRRVADGTRSVYSVTTDTGVQDELTLPAVTGTPPVVGDIFAFGIEDLETKAVLLTNLRESGDLSAELTAVDYAPTVYTTGEMPAWTANVTRSPWVSQNTPQTPAILFLTSDESVLVEDADGKLSPRIQVTYSLTSGTVLADTVRTQYRESGATEWLSAPDVAAGDPAIITGVEEGSTYDIRIKAVADALGLTSAWVEYSSHTVVGRTTPPPNVTGAAVAISGENIRVSWSDTAPIDAHYEVKDALGAVVYSGEAPSCLLPGVATGTHTWTVEQVDDIGLRSATPASVSLAVSAPAKVQGLSARVIDNTVLLFWSAPSQTSFPIATFEVRSGAVFATAETIGEKLGSFISFNELEAGSYTYWVVAVDTAGNVGPGTSVTTLVNQPPGYTLHERWDQDFSAGTATNMIVLPDGSAYAPASMEMEVLTEDGLNSIADETGTALGFPSLQEIPASGEYSKSFDYGTTLNNSKAYVQLITEQNFDGGAAVTTYIGSRASESDPWDEVEGLESPIVGVRYIRVRFEFASTGGYTLYSGYSVRLESKELSDSGTAIITSAVSYGSVTTVAGQDFQAEDGELLDWPMGEAGTVVEFNKAFVDVDSINVTPLGLGPDGKPPIPVVAFSDVPNPRDFQAYLFEYTSGENLTGSFCWTADGH